MHDELQAAVAEAADEAHEFLRDMIRLESTPGNESEIIRFCNGGFAQAGCECKLVPVPGEITDDPEYSRSDKPMSYEGRSNLVAYRRGSGGGKSAILQSHVDVVPGGEWKDAFSPRDDGSWVVGRGACDAKGQVAAIWLAMKALDSLGIQLKGDVHAQIVIEEEAGGNGALALIRQEFRADAAIVMEATELQIHPANRGALWFQIEIEGRPCHMGRKHEGISAIELACKVVRALDDYEKVLKANSVGYRGFERYENPVQVNVGTIKSGTWPATVPAKAVMEGGVGFLPNRSLEQVKSEVRKAIRGIDDQWLRSHFKVGFDKLHNDAYETDYSHPAVLALAQACGDVGLASEVFGWNVSCDARLYAKVGGMPTIVFGPGSTVDAHSDGEKIDFADVKKAAEALGTFLVKWCG